MILPPQTRQRLGVVGLAAGGGAGAAGTVVLRWRLGWRGPAGAEEGPVGPLAGRSGRAGALLGLDPGLGQFRQELGPATAWGEWLIL
jgi:hypothetical protein